MKKCPFLLLFSCALLLFKSGMAQNEFAPLDAEWYHDMRFGIFHSKVTRDTLINGIACRKIDIRAIPRNPDIKFLESDYQYYVYDNTDTVFVYNPFFGRFTPLYVFNANDGDTICIPAPPVEVGQILNYEIDTNFCFIIDSIRIKDWDGRALKTVYTRSYDRDTNDELYPNFTFGENIAPEGVYVERIGSVGKGFLPSCLACIFFLSDSYQPIGRLRCYIDNHNPEYSVTLEDSCDKGIATNIENIQSDKQEFTIYPNPSTNEVNIKFGVPLETEGKWTITDVSGREMHTGTWIQGNTTEKIPLTHFAPGIYFLKIDMGKSGSLTRRISVQ